MAIPSAANRAAFTLLEMLFVLLIISAVAGLAIGSLLRTPTVKRLEGVEHLVSDLVRQAKHTARTSNAPVVLLIRRNGGAAEGTGRNHTTISGVSRICLFSETFEPALPIGATTVSETDLLNQVARLSNNVGRHTAFSAAQNDGATFRMPGHAGYGWLLGDNSGRSEGVLKPFPLDDAGNPVPLNRRNPMMRRPGDGFYLQAAIRPPAVNGSTDVVQVIKVGTDDRSDCFAGIELIRRRTVVQTPAYSLSPPPGNAATVDHQFWSVDGWVTGNVVSSNNHPDLNITLPSNNKDNAAPVGDDWLMVGLLYDGNNLVLYRNGNEVDRKANVAVTAPDGMQIFLGREGGNPGRGAIDNAAVYRLGVDQIASMPKSIESAEDYRITCQPDGRVEVDGGLRELVFNQVGVGNNRPRKATVTITGDGMVTSRIEITK